MSPPTDQLPEIIEPARSGALTPLPTDQLLPTLIADAGDQAAWRYIDFFTSNIRNPNTRRPYTRACGQLFAWCDERGLTLGTIRPFDVATYVEGRQQNHSAPDVKQPLAAVRMLFDWLITGQVVPANPAAAVRRPKHVVKTGKTQVLDGKEWRKLIDAIPTETVRGLRDRALIATLTYSFARIGAALKMKVEDLRPNGAGWQLRLHEKGGKHHTMPCHHALAEALRIYIEAAGIADDRKGWLFRTSRGHTATALSDQPMTQPDAAACRPTARGGWHAGRASFCRRASSPGGSASCSSPGYRRHSPLVNCASPVLSLPWPNPMSSPNVAMHCARSNRWSAKRPFAGPEQVLAYLSRYTHRVALANSRLTRLADRQVDFTWKDYRHHGKTKVMTLAADEFMRRFLLHAVPNGFQAFQHR
jgi:site-specific recombinase XerD